LTVSPDLSPAAIRHVSADLELDVTETADMLFAIAVADDLDCISESFTLTSDGVPLTPHPIGAPHGGRLHQLRGVELARVSVHYDATVRGAAPPIPVGDSEWYQYIRPSRDCESDELGPLARAEFAGLDDHELLAAVSSCQPRAGQIILS
jgi:hypothetical protein